MKFYELTTTLHKLEEARANMTADQRVKTAKLLLDTAMVLTSDLRNAVQEDDAATKRRKAKRRETEVDPKPPVKPVRVAEPPKAKKPKYSGNHAPSARR